VRDAEGKGRKPKIYIHCTAGMGRAPAVACVYLGICVYLFIYLLFVFFAIFFESDIQCWPGERPPLLHIYLTIFMLFFLLFFLQKQMT
jgi:hypothetical protein